MIFFIHIPKTAGTTFYEVVKKNHASFLKPKLNNLSELDLNMLPHQSAIRLPGGYYSAPQTLNMMLDSSSLDKPAFIGGHVGYGFHHAYDTTVRYISFVREPKERLISDYNEHCKPGRFFYDQLREKQFDINYYLELVLNDHLDNIMTRQIAGPYDFYLHERTEVSNKLYQRALGNMPNITFFSQENFDKALMYMFKEFKWSQLGYERKNVAKPYGTVTKNLNESLLEEVIQYDLKLFNEITVVNNSKLSKIEKVLFKLKTW
ncbi:sulfotransferase family 2 domain-containing protein [Hanstruepera ponticola]|uniref:sulfotransferase family 2 domain-containing protein n=1 Tax=Hanstruepera ponticola TaxID=2042995 RepID=UPI0017855E23|nr:sulfotransferase family 2 domain-containing protein [Hanstruepera ponticola]